MLPGSNRGVGKCKRDFSTIQGLGREVGREVFPTSSNELRSGSRSGTIQSSSQVGRESLPPLYKGESSLPDRSTMRESVSRD